MSYAPTRIKQVGEVRTITFDFTDKLNSGDSVAAVVGGALEVASGLTATAPSILANKVTAKLSGGAVTVVQGYRVSCRVTTTQGETLELDVTIRVLDGWN